MNEVANAPRVDKVEHADDVCGLTLARRLAALLDRDPRALREGDPLPRGWHVMLFNTPTRQSQLRHDILEVYVTDDRRGISRAR